MHVLYILLLTIHCLWVLVQIILISFTFLTVACLTGKKENFIPIKYSEGFLFFCFLFFCPTLEKSHGNESDVSKWINEVGLGI